MARAVIQFKLSDLKKDYIAPCDCPIFNALDRAGVPVLKVTPSGFSTRSPLPEDVSDYSLFTKKLLKASQFLADTNWPRRLKARRKLLGQRFQVTW
jgi:hypothetical protein